MWFTSRIKNVCNIIQILKIHNTSNTSKIDTDFDFENFIIIVELFFFVFRKEIIMRRIQLRQSFYRQTFGDKHLANRYTFTDNCLPTIITYRQLFIVKHLADKHLADKVRILPTIIQPTGTLYWQLNYRQIYLFHGDYFFFLDFQYLKSFFL